MYIYPKRAAPFSYKYEEEWVFPYMKDLINMYKYVWMEYFLVYLVYQHSKNHKQKLRCILHACRCPVEMVYNVTLKINN